MLYILDEKDAVRYTAAAATIRLLAIRNAKAPAKPTQAETIRH
jgi:hypothetical protein